MVNRRYGEDDIECDLVLKNKEVYYSDHKLWTKPHSKLVKKKNNGKLIRGAIDK